MFNEKDVSAEIAASMESHLVSHGMEKHAEQLNKFAKALDYLNSVAEIFDELGLRKESEAATTFLEIVAAKKSKKKSKKKPVKPKVRSKRKSRARSKKSDPATKGLTSEKMENNLKEKGWVFNADDDFNFGEDDLGFGDDSHHDSCMCMDCMDADDYSFDDDDNFHYDTGRDASYHIDKNDSDPYGKDEDEQDLARMFHDLEDEDDMRRDFEDDDNFDYRSLRPQNRDTLPSTPAAKRHELDFLSLHPENRPTMPETPAAKHHMPHKGGPKLRFF